MRLAFILIFLLPALAACATSRYCERDEQAYANAAEKPPLQAPEGLQVPPPDPNFAIPDATGEDVGYAATVTDAKGRARSRCLDAPPPLPAAASQPESGLETEPLPEPSADTEPVPVEP